MSDIVIKVRGLGKKYHIGEKLPQRSLTESIKTAARFPWEIAKSMFAGQAGDRREEFWALKDVSFDVKQGEVLGIIGRNGSGKSTLLKVLSRITTPTEGEVEIFGRVGCLLEVGTGFHPELTGRENVFLNGSLLGMANVEIKKRFDEIVDFSGVEKFLDTPVKFYSSGMYTRLAFSVAAHLNPEILIVDEVLAVGDAEFQKKCLGKMDDIAKSGRTILFVSHNMQAIKNICHTGILLNDGKIVCSGEINNCIDHYSHEIEKIIAVKVGERRDRSGNGNLRFKECAIVDINVNPLSTIAVGDDFNLMIKMDCKEIFINHKFNFAVGINSASDVRVVHIGTELLNKELKAQNTEFCILLKIPHLNLSPGIYFLTLFASDNDGIIDWVQNAFRFTVTENDFYKSVVAAAKGYSSQIMVNFEVKTL